VETVALRYPQSVTGESKWIDIDGPVHYVDYGGPAGAPTMVLVHGLMGAHANWLALAPHLTDEYRVIALDLVGHGLTKRAGRRTDVRTNQQVLHRFLTDVVAEPAVLVGNSMGGLISILQAAEKPETVHGLILVAPALPAILTEIPSPTVVLNYLPLAVPGLGTALLSAQHRASNAEDLIRSLLDMVTADPARVSEDVIREHIELAEVRLKISGTPAGYQAAAQSTILMMLQVRDYAATIRSIEAPVLLIQGEQDKVLSPTGARKVAAKNPQWDFESLPDVGHAPMLEVPEQLADSITAWAKNRLA
jgi:pimeloyl-ACP methyl ester carboxylesterase